MIRKFELLIKSDLTEYRAEDLQAHIEFAFNDMAKPYEAEKITLNEVNTTSRWCRRKIYHDTEAFVCERCSYVNMIPAKYCEECGSLMVNGTTGPKSSVKSIEIIEE